MSQHLTLALTLTHSGGKRARNPIPMFSEDHDEQIGYFFNQNVQQPNCSGMRVVFRACQLSLVVRKGVVRAALPYTGTAPIVTLTLHVRFCQGCVSSTEWTGSHLHSEPIDGSLSDLGAVALLLPGPQKSIVQIDLEIALDERAASALPALERHH